MERWEKEKALLERACKDSSIATELLEWISQATPPQACRDETFSHPGSRAEFSAFFITYLKTQTQRFLQVDQKRNPTAITNSHRIMPEEKKKVGVITPKKIDSTQKHNRDNKYAVSDSPCRNNSIFPSENITPPRQSAHCEPAAEAENVQKVTDHILTFATPQSSREPNGSFILSPVTPIDPFNIDRPMRFSTPEGNKPHEFEKSFLPKSNSADRQSSYKREQKSANARSNICIGDFMTIKGNVSDSTPVNRKRRTKKFLTLSLNDPLLNANKENSKYANSDRENYSNLDFNNKDLYPNIGAIKENRARRIKPTRLNMTFPCSESNYFNTPESFSKTEIQFGVKYDKVEQNEAFKVQNCQIRDSNRDYKTERDILKEEKSILIEKFNEMSFNNPKNILSGINPICLKTEPNVQKNVPFDFTDLHHCSTLDLFSNIFCLLMDNNLVINITSEIYYLVSLTILQQKITSKNLSKAPVKTTDNSNAEHLSASLPDNAESTVSPNNDLENKTILLINADNENPNFNCDELFNNISNCVYFALVTLERQKHLLEEILDKNCLNYFIQSDRVNKFSNSFVKYLTDVYNKKITAELKDSECLNSESILNKTVCFISDTDNAENFPSLRNFHSFKSQRDHFYGILRLWEMNHQTPGWDFNSHLGTKIQKLILIDDNPSNLAHLARLFKDQLLTMCSKQNETVEAILHLQVAIGGNGLNKNKINKLAERLTGALPGHHTHLENVLSKRPDFSPCEEFFKDFILQSMNTNFREHLIVSLTQEIHKLNETSFSTSERDLSDSVVDSDTKIRYLLCVRSLRVLGKFLGFLMALPYNKDSSFDNCSSMQRVLDCDKILRNQILPPINLIVILCKSRENGRLILTIPWLVQLLAMLDYTSLRISYFKTLLRILFEIYINNIAQNMSTQLKLVNNFNCTSNQPSIQDHANPFEEDKNVKEMNTMHDSIPNRNKNLIRLCLGWLFDMQHFPQDFLDSWFTNLSSNISNLNDVHHLFESFANLKLNSNSIFENEETTIGMSIDELVKNVNFNRSKEINDKNKIVNTYKADKNTKKSNEIEVSGKSEDFEFNLDSIDIVDDKITKEVCPFLKEFRTLILRSVNSSESNSRNVRHITPVTSSLHSDRLNSKSRDLQIRLEEWFLQSQPGTTRRILELVSERTGAALVRLAKAQLPEYNKRAYEAATLCILQSNKDTHVTEVTLVYKAKLLEFHNGCKKAGKHIGHKRVHSALQGLLSPGTPKPIIEMCTKICTRNALRKLNHCLQTQYNNIRIFTNDLEGDISKIVTSITDNNVYRFKENSKINLSEANTHTYKSMIEKTGTKDKISDPNIKNNSLPYDDVYSSITSVLIELKELLVGFICGTHSEQEFYQKKLSLLNRMNECCQYSWIDKSIKDAMLQMSIDSTIYMLTVYPKFLCKEFLMAAKEAWIACSISSNETSALDIINSEVEHFKKLMLSDNVVCNAGEDFEDITSSKNINTPGFTNKNDSSFCEKQLINDSLLDESMNNYFNSIVCSRNLMIIGGYYTKSEKENSWISFRTFLMFLIKNNFLTEDSFVEQCLALYREDWPETILKNFAKCIRGILDEYDLRPNTKLNLMLDFVSDFCENLEEDFSI